MDAIKESNVEGRKSKVKMGKVDMRVCDEANMRKPLGLSCTLHLGSCIVQPFDFLTF